MAQIGFFVNNINVSKLNLSRLDHGNPGMGGTEYLVLYLSWYLNIHSEYSIKLYATYTAICSSRNIVTYMSKPSICR